MSKLPLLVLSVLLLSAGLLGVSVGNHYPLLVSIVGVLAGGMLVSVQPKRVLWVGSLFGILIFLAGTPLTGAPPACLLISAVSAIYFIALVHQIACGKAASRSFVESTTASPRSIFTVAFYASLLLVYLLLRQHLFPFSRLLAISYAVLILLLSLSLWEMHRRSRLTQVGQVEQPSVPDKLGRVLVILAVALATFLLFRLPLPWMARGTLEVAKEMNLTAPEPNQRPPQPRGEPGTGPLDPTQREPDKEANRLDDDPAERDDGSSDVAETWRRGTLPKQADLDLDELARFHLHIGDEAQQQRALGQSLYLRSHTLDLYENNEWKRMTRTGEFVQDQDDGNQDGWVAFSPVDEERAIGQTIYQYNYLQGAPLMAMPNIHALEAPGVFKQSDDFFSLREAGDITYRVISAPTSYDDIAGLQQLEAGEAEAFYTDTGRGVVFRDIRTLLLDPINKPNLPLKQKLAFLRRLFRENYSYSLKVENPNNHDALANFLFHERRGYCDFFAQAGAHMARALGIPARVGYGYTGGLYDPKLRLFTFRGSDAHSWTEILLKDHGWVIFDLVPVGNGARRPAQTSDANAESGVRDPLRRFREASEALEKQQQERAALPDHSLSSDLEDWFKGAWLARYFDWILGGIIVGLLASYVWRRWRQTDTEEGRESKRAAKRRRGTAGYFRDFCELFGKLGHQRPEGQTLREYVMRLKSADLIDDEFDGLLDYHYTVEYESGPRQKDTEKGFQRAIREFRKRVL